MLTPFNYPAVVNNGSIAGKGSDTYAVGPFAAGAGENPTFTFTPIQGQDFANRFESSLTDKFTYFLEDERWAPTTISKPQAGASTRRDEGSVRRDELVELFADGLDLKHGLKVHRQCDKGSYSNARPQDPSDSAKAYWVFYNCVKYITDERLRYTQLDTVPHQIPATAGPATGPATADAVSAFGQGLVWAKNGEEYVLSNAARMPAWLDYDPRFTPLPPAKQAPKPDDLAKLDPVFWPFLEKGEKPERLPSWEGLAYKLPAKYHLWKLRDSHKYVLMPDGYSFRKPEEGKPEGYIDPYQRLYKVSPAPKDQPSYADEIARAVWPVQQDYFYVELRHPPIDTTDTTECPPKDLPQTLTDDDVAKVCVEQAPCEPKCDPKQGKCSNPDPLLISDPEKAKSSNPDPLSIVESVGKCSYAEDATVGNVVCGYLKIGHLLQILERLGGMACTDYEALTTDNQRTDCSQSIFGVGPKVPSLG